MPETPAIDAPILTDNAGSFLASSHGYLPEAHQNKRERSEPNLRGKAAFKSAHVEWGTPPDLRAALDQEFHFTLDPCEPGLVWDGRAISWSGKRVFCNPPYGKGVDKWLAKGREAEVAVYLLPARTDTKWFHDFALKADEIRFFRGRIKFVENHIAPYDGWSGNGAPFPSMLVIYRSGAVAPAPLEDNVPDERAPKEDVQNG